jgi:NADH-quinone oxidoreductase subunit B
MKILEIARKGTAMNESARRHHSISLPMMPAKDAYTPGQQEPDVLLTTLRDLLQWAQNYPRSRSLWPFTFATACCGMEMAATAHSHYDLSRWGSEVFRASPRPEALIEGILKLREKIEKQGLRIRGE